MARVKENEQELLYVRLAKEANAAFCKADILYSSVSHAILLKRSLLAL